MTPEVRELCQEVILDHGKKPRNFHELAAARNAVSCERFGSDLPIKRIERRSSVITLTPSARQAVGEILAQQELPPTAALRMGVTTEGCEGRATQFKYVLDFDPNPGKASDQVFESDGLTIVVDHESPASGRSPARCSAGAWRGAVPVPQPPCDA